MCNFPKICFSLLLFIFPSLLSGCQEASLNSPAPVESEMSSISQEEDPIEVPVAEESSVDQHPNIPQELLVDANLICPDCGHPIIDIENLEYEVGNFLPKQFCTHGGYPNLLDTFTEVEGHYMVSCSSCDYTNSLTIDKSLLYCPYEKSYYPNIFPQFVIPVSEKSA